jgi:hypothetical protein
LPPIPGGCAWRSLHNCMAQDSAVERRRKARVRRREAPDSTGVD